MRALVQRVREASVSVSQVPVARIQGGLLILLGVRTGDDREGARRLAQKVTRLRIFEDESGKMNRSVRDINGEILVVSQFTLYGETSKGNRPSFAKAATAEIARPLYEDFVNFCREECGTVQTGLFQASMDVLLINSGPVTLLCESES